MQLRAVGPNGRIPSSSTTTSSMKVGTLQPGNSQSSWWKSCAQVSDHCVNKPSSRKRREIYGKRFFRHSVAVNFPPLVGHSSPNEPPDRGSTGPKPNKDVTRGNKEI